MATQTVILYDSVSSVLTASEAATDAANSASNEALAAAGIDAGYISETTADPTTTTATPLRIRPDLGIDVTLATYR